MMTSVETARSRPLRLASFALAAYCLFVSALVSAQSNPADIQAQIAVRPEFARYAELLSAPSYALVALDTIQMSPLSRGRMVIQDRASFHYGILEARFVGHQREVYRYEGKVEWNLAVTTAALSAVMELDTTRLPQGIVSMRVSFPLARLLPDQLADRIRAKLSRMGEASTQDQLLVYLAGLQKRIDAAPMPKPSLFELILLDAHNRSMPVGSPLREAGDAEPLSDQIALILTLLIWFVAMPLAFVLRRRYLARRARDQRT
jgi:hypothetical protein